MNLFELFVKIGVDDQASDKLSNLSSKLGNGLKTAAKIGTAAVGAAASGITALTTAAVNNYAEYEQLIGGVETLYGAKYKTIEEYIEGTGAAAEYAEQTFAEYQKRQQAVLDNAANAYKTAGMSANEYMNTVNGFAASLTSSLGEYEWQAASYADMIVSDMADNANKMGTNMEMIQNAYAGFAKQNYTMLDNLKLGYGGTKTEMERLLRDAERMAGYIEGSLDIESFADISDAIHIVQEEMGITGTTALEAGRTISGSVGSMKAAWENLLTGLADGNADIKSLIDDLVITIVGDGTEANLGVLGNILPAVEMAINGIGTVVEKTAPIISEKLPGIVQDVLPSLLSASASLISGLVSAIPSLIQVLLQQGPIIIKDFANAMMTTLPEIINVAKGIITTIIDGIVKNTPDLLSNGVKMLADFSANLRKNLGTIFDAGIDTLLKFVDGIVEAMPDLIAYIPEIVSNIANIINDNAPKLLLSAAEIIWKLVTGLINNIPVIIQNLPKIISAIVDTLLAFNWVNLGTNIIQGLGNGLKSMVSFVKDIGNQVVNAIKSGISNLPSQMISIGKNIVSGLWNGIKSMISGLGSKIKSFAGGIVSTAKNALEIRSPSRVFRDQIGKQMAAGLGIGWDEGFDDVKSEIEDSLRFEDASVGINASIRKVGAGASGMAYGGTSIGNITINIDGAKYTDEQSLASAIAQEIQNMTDRRAAVYA